jgi:hypothetical protein
MAFTGFGFIATPLGNKSVSHGIVDVKLTPSYPQKETWNEDWRKLLGLSWSCEGRLEGVKLLFSTEEMRCIQLSE